MKKYRDIMRQMQENKIDRVNSLVGSDPQALGHLTRAIQHATHVMLAELDKANDVDMYGTTNEEEDGSEEVVNWLARLSEGRQWESSRMLKLTEICRKIQDIAPTAITLIFSESKYTLDVVEVALSRLDPPVKCFRFDGTMSRAERDSVQQNYATNRDTRTVLITRACGYQGLQFSEASQVILMEPWWTRNWEYQAIKRAHRNRQKQEVVVHRIRATNSGIDTMRKKVQTSKAKSNQMILQDIVKEDSAEIKLPAFVF